MEPEVARCPGCGAPFSEAAVLSMVPVCASCGAASVVFGGTMGTIGAYGVNHPGLTRQRVQADIDVLRQHERRLVGLIEANKQQLNWDRERYATLPSKPVLRTVRPPLPLLDRSCWAIGIGFLLLIVQGYVLRIIPGLVAVLKPYDGCGLVLAVWAALAVVVFIGLGFAYEFKNGTELQFNRGQELRYESAVASALKAAEPLKAAQDHRLSVQIRDGEAAVKTIRKQMSSVQAVLDRL